MIIRSVSTVLVCFVLTFRAYGWGDQGHQIVARIAARNLTKDAREKIAVILRAAKPDDLKLIAIIKKTGTPSAAAIEKAFIKMATWPDHMPGGKGPTAPWHFIDIGLFEGPSHITERCGAGCVNQKVAEIVKNLSKGDPLGDFAPDRELRFLVHFLGDIHQPLHAATNADAGGNCILAKSFNGSKELHAVWDTGLVRAVIAQSSGDATGAIIAALKGRMAEFQIGTDPDQIAAGSFELARSKVYDKATPKIPTIDHFVQVSVSKCKTEAPPEIVALRIDTKGSFDNTATLDVVREQLFKGGVRLAAILNAL